MQEGYDFEIIAAYLLKFAEEDLASSKPILLHNIQKLLIQNCTWEDYSKILTWSKSQLEQKKIKVTTGIDRSFFHQGNLYLATKELDVFSAWAIIVQKIDAFFNQDKYHKIAAEQRERREQEVRNSDDIDYKEPKYQNLKAKELRNLSEDRRHVYKEQIQKLENILTGEIIYDQDKQLLEVLNQLQFYADYMIAENRHSDRLRRLMVSAMGYSTLQEIILLCNNLMNVIFKGNFWNTDLKTYSTLIYTEEQEVLTFFENKELKPHQHISIHYNNNDYKNEILVMLSSAAQLQPKWLQNFGTYSWKISQLEYLDDQRVLGERSLNSGKMIHHSKSSNEMILEELLIDASNFIHGNYYEDIERKLARFEDNGVTHILVNGAFENKGNPFACRDRIFPLSSRGGQEGLERLIRMAKRHQLKVILGYSFKFSSSYFSKKYEQFCTEYLFEDRKYPLYTSLGKVKKAQDSKVPNFRDLQTWNHFVEELVEISSKYQISGFCFESAESFPIYYQMDKTEMQRKELDGSCAYSKDERLKGRIVRKGASFALGMNLKGRSNSLLNYIKTRISEEIPDLIFLADYNALTGEIDKDAGQIRTLIQSGFIPKMNLKSVLDRYKDTFRDHKIKFYRYLLQTRFLLEKLQPNCYIVKLTSDYNGNYLFTSMKEEAVPYIALQNLLPGPSGFFVDESDASFARNDMLVNTPVSFVPGREPGHVELLKLDEDAIKKTQKERREALTRRENT